MISPLTKYIIGKRVILRAEVDHKSIEAYEAYGNKPTTHKILKSDNVDEIVKNQIMDNFSRGLKDTRFKDIKTTQTPQHVTYELELFIFNEDEIKKLIEEVANYNR